jgi:hypothetical protein
MILKKKVLIFIINLTTVIQNFVKLCCGGDDIPTAGANVMDGLRSVQGTFKKRRKQTQKLK